VALAISSTHVSVGERVTVTGTGCPTGHWGQATLVPDNEPAIFHPGNGGLYGLDETSFLTADGFYAGAVANAVGRWTFTATVPMVPSGTATLNGWCNPQENGDSGMNDFTYPPGARVTVSSRYQVEVSPGTIGKPGSTLRLNLFGGACPGPAVPYIYLYSAASTQLTQANWVSGFQYTLTVPADLAAGDYRLEADCLFSRGAVYGSYAPVTIAVR
jgi:hypothetical protein